MTERLATAFTLAHDAGELPRPPDAADAAARLVGPLLYRTAPQAGTVPPGMIEDVVDDVLG